MKKDRLTILMIIVAIFLCACSRMPGKNENAIHFYYYQPSQNSAKAVMGTELYTPKDADFGLQSIIKAYLKGPQNTDLQLLFPKETTIVELIKEDNLLTVTLSKHCANMSRIDLTVSCSCLARTLLPITSATQICIQADGGFSNVEDPLIFTEDTILTEDPIVQ